MTSNGCVVGQPHSAHDKMAANRSSAMTSLQDCTGDEPATLLSCPFVTSIETPAALQDALRAALRNVARSDEWAQARAGLMLQDIVHVELESYSVQMQYEREAHASGYSELR